MNALLVAAGDMPTCEHLLTYADSETLKIAVDGGLLAFDRYGILPDIILGDMDSLDKTLLEKYKVSAGVEIIRAQVEKNETDGMLALDTAIGRGAKKVVMLGATGGRIDHLLSNLMLLKRAYQKGVEMLIEDAWQEIRIAKDDFVISGAEGQTVSIIPAGDRACVDVFSGVYYPLEQLLLTNYQPRGISNVMTAGKAIGYSDDYIYIIKNK